MYCNVGKNKETSTKAGRNGIVLVNKKLNNYVFLFYTLATFIHKLHLSYTCFYANLTLITVTVCVPRDKFLADVIFFV